MKRNLAVFFAVVVMILAALVGYPDAASTRCLDTQGWAAKQRVRYLTSCNPWCD